jgi:hypothetical protein
VVSSYLRSDGREVESVVYREQKLVRTLVYDREAPPFALFDLTNDGAETDNLLETRGTAFDFLDCSCVVPPEAPSCATRPGGDDEATRRRPRPSVTFGEEVAGRRERY